MFVCLLCLGFEVFWLEEQVSSPTGKSPQKGLLQVRDYNTENAVGVCSRPFPGDLCKKKSKLKLLRSSLLSHTLSSMGSRRQVVLRERCGWRMPLKSTRVLTEHSNS